MSVPAQFLTGAYQTHCHRCKAAVWSVVWRSQPRVAGRFSRLPPIRAYVEDDGADHEGKCTSGYRQPVRVAS